jgi:iron complex outermembrane receptor protein
MKFILHAVFLVIFMSNAALAFAGGDMNFDELLPTVLTPTRLRQSLSDVPASVTVITSEMIQRYGITTIPDALRLVPGMAITQSSGDDYRINYHGTNILVPRRMNVLIDGVSVYRPALSRVEWSMLPIVIDDVARIEVTRGPNSASYGANSMLAIINIITKRPQQTSGAMISGGYGSQNTFEGTLRYSGHLSNSTDYQISLNQTSTEGYDSVKNGNNVSIPAHDSIRMTRLNYRVITEFDSTQSLDINATLVKGSPNFQFIDATQITSPDAHTNDLYFSVLWKKTLSDAHELQVSANNTRNDVKQEWRTCPPLALFLPEMYQLWRVNPSYAASIASGKLPKGGSASDDALAIVTLNAIRKLGVQGSKPSCVDANQNLVQQRMDFEVQDTSIISEYLRVVSGLGVRQDAVDSETYANGYVRNRSYRAFINIEYKPSQFLNINAGGFIEKSNLSDSLFSPRLAANVHFDKKQTVRFIISKGSRMPDINELINNWSYHVKNMSVPLNGSTTSIFYQNAHGVGSLQPENITSKEIGYMLNIPEHGLVVDAKIFDDHLTNLISEKNQLSDFHPTNKNSAKLQGFELQVNYDPSDLWSAFFNYSFMPTSDATSQFEKSQYSKHSGSMGLSHKLDNEWRTSISYYASGGDGYFQSSYGRTDLALSKAMHIGSYDVQLNFTVRHLNNLQTSYLDTLTRARTSSLNSANQYYISTVISY